MSRHGEDAMAGHPCVRAREVIRENLDWLGAGTNMASRDALDALLANPDLLAALAVEAGEAANAEVKRRPINAALPAALRPTDTVPPLSELTAVLATLARLEFMPGAEADDLSERAHDNLVRVVQRGVRALNQLKVATARRQRDELEESEET